MSLNPAMLGVRFLLELCALASFAVYGWRASDGPLRFVLVVLLPVVAAAAWGVFAVPDDPSRNGAATVVVSGIVRIGIEALVLWGAVAALWFAGLPRWALGFGIALLVYHLLAHDRIPWLLRH